MASRVNGTNGASRSSNGNTPSRPLPDETINKYNDSLKKAADPDSGNNAFHGDASYGETHFTVLSGVMANIPGAVGAMWGNKAASAKLLIEGLFSGGKNIDMKAGSDVIAAFKADSALRKMVIDAKVKGFWDKMLHPPPSFLGDAFQFRQADGSFNSVLYPHLGQAGAPYAKTVAAKSKLLGAQPDPGDIFDRLLARDEFRESKSGLSSMLIYHATIIIHDIFRTNSDDRNISDTSSYLDLSPLYGFNEEMCNSVRDREQGLGLLKPDSFAEDRLLRQPPGVCAMLVMYNRYHNYAATQLRRINENGRFSVPAQFRDVFSKAVDYQNKKLATKELEERQVALYVSGDTTTKLELVNQAGLWYIKPGKDSDMDLAKAMSDGEKKKFKEEYDAAWRKLDDDLFGTARLITCGMYINVCIHDYLRALMGFHNMDTTFTLDPRTDMDVQGNKLTTPKGCGNQVSVEFNLLYRFHMAISKRDEGWTRQLLIDMFSAMNPDPEAKKNFDPEKIPMKILTDAMRVGKGKHVPERATFGKLKRDPVTNMFKDNEIMHILLESMNDPIGEFGPRNIPKILKPIEILGILQARKWEIGTLNDFREFFGMERHQTFESVTPNKSIQEALRDLYDHPDKIELYPGIFCEGDINMMMDPGPSETASTLWSAIFSDAITLVRSDRFYTTDWNTNSLTAWGMREVTPDDNVLKSSVFHRLIQRSFPGYLPYNSMYYFHPFYTYQKNKELAVAQGYDKWFYKYKEELEDDAAYAKQKKTEEANQPSWPWSWIGKKQEAKEVKKEFRVYCAPEPSIPHVIKDFATAKLVLTEHPHRFVEPASLDPMAVPEEIRIIMNERYKDLHSGKRPPPIMKEPELKKLIYEYFDQMTREIIEREVTTVRPAQEPKDGKLGSDPIYQIDATRDLAIPVVTHLVAHFLGMDDKIKTQPDAKNKYTENEIYRHITNCQMFLAYNVDETKLWKRRMAFKESIDFLFEHAKAAISKSSKAWYPAYEDPSKPAKERIKSYSNAVAYGLKEKEKSKPNLAAAALLLTALDAAYNSTTTFTSVLDYFLDVSTVEKDPNSPPNDKKGGVPYWSYVQELALSAEDKTDAIMGYVMEAQRLKVRLPLFRQLKDDEQPFALQDGTQVLPGQKVIIDIYSASRNISLAPSTFVHSRGIEQNLLYCHGFSEGSFEHDARQISLWGLTAMFRVLGQLKRLRPAPGPQGVLKRVNIEQRYNYSNYMSKGEINRIKEEWDQILREKKVTEWDVQTKENKVVDLTPEYEADIRKKQKEFGKTILQSRTYLTPEWSEMVPFPYTWKIRFDGYGRGMYEKPSRRDDQFDMYQTQESSRAGGCFSSLQCLCLSPQANCQCQDLAKERADLEANERWIKYKQNEAQEKAKKEAKKQKQGLVMQT